MRPKIAAERESQERREPTIAEFDFDASPQMLRESLAAVGNVLRSGDAGIERRVRLLLGEIIGRSCDPRRHPSGLIRIKLAILPSNVRVEIAGVALLTPQELGEPDREGAASFPGWVLDELADQWGLDRRTSEPAMWFLVEQAA